MRATRAKKERSSKIEGAKDLERFFVGIKPIIRVRGFGDFCHFFLNTLNKNQNPPSDFRLHPFFLLVIV